MMIQTQARQCMLLACRCAGALDVWIVHNVNSMGRFKCTCKLRLVRAKLRLGACVRNSWTVMRKLINCVCLNTFRGIADAALLYDGYSPCKLYSKSKAEIAHD